MLLTKLIESSLQNLGKSSNLHYRIIGENNIDISSLTDDSRRVTSGALFFAVKGVHIDGHQYINKAIENGAFCIVTEAPPISPIEDVCYIVTNNSKEVMGLMAAAWYGHPSRDMSVVGVTGTNGKTTIATLLYRLYTSAGYACGLLSTVCNYINEVSLPSTHTTPGALQLQELLAKMRDAGCSYVFMEVSSHAVDQRRIAGISFKGGIFTNLSRDHLDYHKTVREYLYAKKRFFDELDKDSFALSNADDSNGEVMLQNTQAKASFYALNSPAQFMAQILEQYADSTLIDIAGREVLVRLVGRFNAYNLLAVYATATLLSMPSDEVLRYLSTLSSVNGRLETFHSPNRGYTAFVDYAHTPDALVNVLQTLHTLKEQSARTEARIICVVGCGGDRDRGKRPVMTSEALRHADIVILTSDNPRSEEPEAIIEEMLQGVPLADTERVNVIVEREQAIRQACSIAQPSDLVLIAGKGHETYQEIKGVRYPFDDREIIRTHFAQEAQDN